MLLQQIPLLGGTVWFLSYLLCVRGKLRGCDSEALLQAVRFWEVEGSAIAVWEV
ncbi:hypothetical protein [Dolichospermum circinale]|uniref:hypothetical protein n=1 Tax=Dolichospermum circinale TaxID=109265 RepID=UPI000404183E|nr:hypothetical protein [Dolichospermum circinale]